MASISTSPRCPAQLCLIIALLASCRPSQISQPPPTASQTLNVTLWVEWPVVRYGWEQSAHVIVTDENGDRLSGATVLGKYISPAHTSQMMVFPLTDADGYTSLLIQTPEHGVSIETNRIDVQATWRGGYGRAWTEYQMRP